jgi:hypothetical protein
MYDRASSSLRDVNGAARLMRSGFRPVDLDGHFSDPAGSTRAVVRANPVDVRVRIAAADGVVGSGGGVQQQSAAANYVQLSTKHTAVQEVLDLLGKPEPAPDWYDLYKIYEIVGDQVAGGPKGREQALTATAWVTPNDLDAFKASANHPAASGTGARHARQSGSPPKRMMTIGDARHVIRTLVTRWLDSPQGVDEVGTLGRRPLGPTFQPVGLQRQVPVRQAGNQSAVEPADRAVLVQREGDNRARVRWLNAVTRGCPEAGPSGNPGKRVIGRQVGHCPRSHW